MGSTTSSSSAQVSSRSRVQEGAAELGIPAGTPLGCEMQGAHTPILFGPQMLARC